MQRAHRGALPEEAPDLQAAEVVVLEVQQRAQAHDPHLGIRLAARLKIHLRPARELMCVRGCGHESAEEAWG